MKQKLKTILIGLSTICLSSCRDGFPSITPKERCVVVLQETMEASYCRCHQYAWSIDHIGRTTDSTNYDLSKCNKLIGFSPDASAQIYDWQEGIRLWLNRQKD